MFKIAKVPKPLFCWQRSHSTWNQTSTRFTTSSDHVPRQDLIDALLDFGLRIWKCISCQGQARTARQSFVSFRKSLSLNQPMSTRFTTSSDHVPRHDLIDPLVYFGLRRLKCISCQGQAQAARQTRFSLLANQCLKSLKSESICSFEREGIRN